MNNRKKRYIYKLLSGFSLIGIIVCFILLVGSYLYMNIGHYDFNSFSQIRQYNAQMFQLVRFDQVIFIILFLCAIIYKLSHNKYKQLNLGIVGEEETQNILSILPDNYIVLNNIPIYNNGQKSEIDNLIISTKGIVIVETKNYNGGITGNEESSTWLQTKISMSGKTYANEIKNPVKQLNRQISILSQVLSQNGISGHIDGYVYMAGGQCSVVSEKVATSEKDLLNKIMYSGQDNTLSQSDIDFILTIFNKYRSF